MTKILARSLRVKTPSRMMPTSGRKLTSDEHPLVHQPVAATHNPAHLRPCPMWTPLAMITATSPRSLPPLLQLSPMRKRRRRRKSGRGASLCHPSSPTTTPIQRLPFPPLSPLPSRHHHRLKLPSSRLPLLPSLSPTANSRASPVVPWTSLASRLSLRKQRKPLRLFPVRVSLASDYGGYSEPRAIWACFWRTAVNNETGRKPIDVWFVSALEARWSWRMRAYI